LFKGRQLRYVQLRPIRHAPKERETLPRGKHTCVDCITKNNFLASMKGG
jgi:hypothetical protein